MTMRRRRAQPTITQLPIPEFRVQSALVDHWKIRGRRDSILAAIPNGELRDKVVAAKLKAMGVHPGMPDMFAVGDFGHGFLELKYQPPRSRDPVKDMSDDQKRVMARLHAAGIEARVTNDLDEAIAILEGWGVLRGNAA